MRYLVYVFLGLILLIGGLYLLNQPRGVLTYSEYSYPSFGSSAETDKNPIQSTTIESSKSAESEPSLEWETYVNNLHGYSFRYPKGWSLKECGDQSYGILNLYLDPKPIEECNSESFPPKVPVISISDTGGESADEILLSARRDMGQIAHFIEKSSKINEKTYRQYLFQLKIIPPFLLPSSTGVGTFIEHSQREQVVIIGLVGLDDGEQGDIYRQIISSFNFIDKQPAPSGDPDPS